MTVRKFQPEVRLKKLLAEPGGITASQALDNAMAGIEEIRADCLSGIDGKIAELTLLAQASAAAEGEKIYRIANEVFGEAGALGLSELSRAAHSLCSLVESGERLGQSQLAAVMVHVDALRALRNPQMDSDKPAREAVLEGLRKLSARMAAQKRI